VLKAHAAHAAFGSYHHRAVRHAQRLHSGADTLRCAAQVPSTTKRRDTFLYIGERCNVAGSIMYKKAIVDGLYDKAAAIAVKQARTRSLSSSLLLSIVCVRQLWQALP
jgi:hypothetical protein